MAEHLRVGEASLAYAVLGRGPGLLVPWCNHPWLDMPYLSALAEHHTVVVASPRGYQASTRLHEPDQYSTDLLVIDLLAVCDHVGVDHFSVLGYSLTAAMAAWLARASERVDAVVAGGFPLLGSYGAVLARAERDIVAMTADADAAAALRAEFDPHAALAFYRELAALPDGALVTDVRCPMLAFWGTADDLLGSFDTATDLGRDLRERGVTTFTLDGLDHVGAVLGLGEIVTDIVAWLSC